jgi:hypothetical protein
VEEVAFGVPNRLDPVVEGKLPFNEGCDAVGKSEVDVGCEVAGWEPPKLNILPDAGAAGVVFWLAPNTNPPDPAPFVEEAEFAFANGLFMPLLPDEKSKVDPPPPLPNPVPPLPNPPNDTFGEPLPTDGVPFVGGKLEAEPFVAPKLPPWLAPKAGLRFEEDIGLAPGRLAVLAFLILMRFDVSKRLV